MNTLLQESLLSTQHINHAAIIRRRDGAIKAQTQHLILTPSELQVIEKAFEDPHEARSSNNPIKIMEIPYKPIRVDEAALYGKREANGLIIARTKNYYIMGTYEPDMVPSIAAEAVEKLADYFRKKDK